MNQEELPVSPHETRLLGQVVSGSLSHGLEVKLEPGVSVEEIKVGRYVVIEGQGRRFFGMTTDVRLGAIDERLPLTLPDLSSPFVARVVAGTGTYGEIHVTPHLALETSAQSLLEGPQAAKTIPAHFAPVREASQQDVALVFGAEDEKHFFVGTPLDMETRVCLNLAEFVKRSNGVFGKSGTGKTFFTRLLLVGILQKRQAVSLVFDMHNEYGWEGGSEGGRKVKGLKQLFPAQVALFTLDPANARRRRVSADFEVEIGYDQIEPEDIELLRPTLNLTPPAVEAVHQLARRFGDKRWLASFLDLPEEEAKELTSQLHIEASTYRNLRRGLDKLQRLPFLVRQARDDSVGRLLEYLERGTHVVLEFGGQDNLTAYILVANLLTRRLHDIYRERTERALGEGGAGPRPLLIVIEEAHKFLNPELSDQTIFGIIAREMRKYNVTLLVIDQRPSGIDEEVMSQLGTRVIYPLDNEQDVENALSGVPGKAELRTVLSRLDSKQQALILGHALRMPLVIRTREYGTADSYRELAHGSQAPRQTLEELWRNDPGEEIK